MLFPSIPSFFYLSLTQKKKRRKEKKTHRLTFRNLSSLPLDAFAQPMNPVRKPCSHTIIPKDYANDDEVR